MGAAIENGRASGAKPALLTDDERNAIVREVMEQAERSTIEEFRTVGAALGASNVVSPCPLFGGSNIGFLMGVSQFGGVCTSTVGRRRPRS